MTNRFVRSWIVPLKAHRFDLEDLPLYLEGYRSSVVEREGKFYLVLRVDVVGADNKRILPFAREEVALINGAAAVTIQGFRQIELEGGTHFGLDGNGQVISTIVPTGTAECRAKAGQLTVSINGVSQPDTRTGQLARLLLTAVGSTAMSDALAVMGRPSPSWSELYLAYELVESNASARMYSQKWIERSEGTLFTRTANSYTALGRDGRHGKETGQPPRAPMTRAEAIYLMRRLVSAWVASEASQLCQW